jgi:ABC-type multidrug transport system fused ATPase/permease subunit
MEVPAAKVLGIGRARDNDIVVADLQVSRHHAELRRSPRGQYEIADLGSHNGTFLNGQRITRAAVNDADVVGIGPASFRLVGDQLQEFVDAGDVSLEARGLTVTLPNGKVLLDDVSFALPERCLLGVIGPSGAGKSTLADVAVRFLPIDAGEAALDRMPLQRLAADDLRRVVGLVGQHPHLFDTTLAENLRVGRRSAADVELEAVMRRVGLGEWLSGLPDGLATTVGRSGQRLSGGQRQRMAVARALLADFDILVLDEPVEHLDPVAADALTADLLGLTAGRSTLLITHRLRGLEQVDEIVVLDAGRVVERGTHAELLAAGGRYAGFWWEERMSDRPAAQPAARDVTDTISEGSDQP